MVFSVGDSVTVTRCTSIQSALRKHIGKSGSIVAVYKQPSKDTRGRGGLWYVKFPGIDDKFAYYGDELELDDLPE